MKKNTIYNIDGEYVVSKVIKDGSSTYSTFSQIKKSNLVAAYGLSEKEIGNILAFDGFTILPENDPALFKQSVKIGKELLKLNLYEPPIYRKLKLGEGLMSDYYWGTIDDLILKIAPDEKPFPNSKFTYNQLILDYLAIAWKNPTQRLPALILKASDNNYYVELFFELIQTMFQRNATFVHNKDLSSSVNNGWGLSNFLLINEKEISVEMMDWINRESSNTTRNIIYKDFPGFHITNYSKIIVSSDEIWNFPENEEANLHLVIEPLHISEEEDDSILAFGIEIELPYFLDYLANDHKILTEKESSVWFNFNDIKTPVIDKLQKRSKSLFYNKVLDTLKSQILDRLLKYSNGICEFSLSGFRKTLDIENVKKADLKEALKIFGVRPGTHKENFICSISGQRVNAIPYYISDGDLKQLSSPVFSTNLSSSEIEFEA